MTTLKIEIDEETAETIQTEGIDKHKITDDGKLWVKTHDRQVYPNKED